MKRWGGFLISVLLTYSAGVAAEAVYPSKIPMRLLGLNQKRVGSCQAEAEVGALEHSFARWGYPIQLSTFYRHARNRIGSALHQLTLQDYVGPDKDWLGAGSPEFIPLAYWPEDQQGFETASNRPSLHLSSVFTPGLPALPITRVVETFSVPNSGRWSNMNTPSFEELKSRIRQGVPMAISMHSDLFYRFNKATGLIEEPYRRDWLPSDVAKLVEADDHAVAVVGFDDDLYKDHGYPEGPGAIIVRNSWNDWSEIDMSTRAMRDPSLRAELEKFRLKIAPDNLPGYYALPYQYVRDKFNFPTNEPHAARGIGGIYYFNIDFNAVYNVYKDLTNRVRAMTVPFVCNRGDLDVLVNEFSQIRARVNNPDGKRAMFRFLSRQATARSARIKIARLAQIPGGTDRVRDFAEGKFAKYYCMAADATNQFPNSTDLQDPRWNEMLELMRVGEGTLTSWYRFFEWLECKKNKGVCI